MSTIEKLSSFSNRPATRSSARILAVVYIRAVATALVKRLQHWARLHRERRQLAALDAAALKDLGIDAAAAWQESQLPFWNEPAGRDWAAAQRTRIDPMRGADRERSF